MTTSRSALSRRALLGAAALLPVAGCANTTSRPATTPSSTTPSSTTPSPFAHAAAAEHRRQFVALERKYDARLGIYAFNTGSGATVAHRADERFAFCSTFKFLATAAILRHRPLSHLNLVVKYAQTDLLKNAVVTKNHVASGMTIRQLCDAAVRYSDGTAGNLLLRDLGGPARLTSYARSLGDTVTRMDRIEPAITTAIPGDPRDTTSPAAYGATFAKIVLGDALPADKRAFLVDLLKRNATSAGAKRIRAGLPSGWTVADKTGTGDYGTLNDIGIVWPPNAAPLVVAIMSSKTTKDAEYRQELLAEAAKYATSVLVPAK